MGIRKLHPTFPNYAANENTNNIMDKHSPHRGSIPPSADGNVGPFAASSSYSNSTTPTDPSSTTYLATDVTMHSISDTLSPDSQLVGHDHSNGIEQNVMFRNNEARHTPSIRSPTRVSAAALAAANQKRAYRQRRKEPSCDACRERKVKCDANDTRGCSECSSRGVKCQFTKETNRRMSSIKQVQDLERQLTQARQQINRLQASATEGGTGTDAGPSVAPAPSLQLTETSGKDHWTATPVSTDYNEVQKNLRNYTRGIYKPPPPYRQFGPDRMHSEPQAPLPPKHVVDQLLAQYRNSVHNYAPVVHLPTFTQEVEELYRVGSVKGQRFIWVALFYIVLACGTLVNPIPNHVQGGASEGTNYLDRGIMNVDIWTDELTMDHVRVSLLISIYLTEINLRSPAWVYLGSAVHIAQDIGLHIDRGTYPPMESEMRKRVFWSVYNWDRILCMEMNRPFLISDDDCDVAEPVPVDDGFLYENGNLMQAAGQVAPSALIAVIPVTRVASQLKKTMKSRTIGPGTLATCDEHFKSVIAALPHPFPIESQAPLDPRLLYAACALQSQKFFLYRHNLSPACRKIDRSDALNRCVRVAQDTARFVQRSMAFSASPYSSDYSHAKHMEEWASRARAASRATFCTHLWRCELVLILRGDYESALTLVQHSAACGDLRKINVACGRYLAFFLDQLIRRLQAGMGQEALEADEEMLAYVSGDLQGSIDNSWAWTGSETGASLRMPHDEISKTNPSFSASERFSISALSERETQEWGGWMHVQNMLRQLLHEMQSRRSAAAGGFVNGGTMGGAAAGLSPGGPSHTREPQLQPQHHPPTPSQPPPQQQPPLPPPPLQHHAQRNMHSPLSRSSSSPHSLHPMQQPPPHQSMHLFRNAPPPPTSAGMPHYSPPPPTSGHYSPPTSSGGGPSYYPQRQHQQPHHQQLPPPPPPPPQPTPPTAAAPSSTRAPNTGSGSGSGSGSRISIKDIM